jgi:hypothetical protein
MFKVKIINGKAIDVDNLNIEGKVIRMFTNFFMERFEVEKRDEYLFPITEGQIYLAWPIGKGKVVLLDQVSETY